MEQALLDLLARLADEGTRGDVTDEELASLEAGIQEVVSTVDRGRATSQDIELLREAAEALDVVRAEAASRTEAAEERTRQAEELLARIAPAAEEAPAESGETEGGEEPPAAESAEPAEPAAAEEAPAEPAPEPVAAAAAPTPAARSLPSIRQLSARRPAAARPQPTATDNGRRAPVLTASADLPGLSAGTAVELAPWGRAVESKIDAIRKTRNDGADGEGVHFGTIRADYPEERILDMNQDTNQVKLDAVASPQALAASGGICGPVAVDYNVATIAIADRPVKAAMAQFAATRGGVRFILPHTLAAVTADGPTAIWTSSNDANPTNPTVKPHAVFACQAVQEVYVDAVTSIVQFGNFQARYFPEQLQQYMETVDAVHARLGDATLLGALTAGSTAVTADNYELGAARDLLAILDRAAAGMRFRHRMRPGTPLRMLGPLWLKDMVRADLTRQAPGDSGAGMERLATTDAQIDNFLAVRNINTSWALDSPTGAGILQGWGIQGAGQLLPWPLQTSIWLYPEGSWTFLDGGELNLGMVRDSILNRTNDFQFFSETFEKAVFRGHESQQINLKLAPTGASAGTVATFTGGAETVGS